MQDYLRRILTARVYDVARETELEFAPQLSARTDNRVLLKREDNQPVFSFKLRGAYNRMAQLTAAERSRGVIAASAGNHAQGVALAAARLGLHATIVMPITTPQVKIEAVRRHGGHAVEIVLAGDSFSDAYAHALAIKADGDLTFIHPFDDPDVIAGQGTIGMEVLRQHEQPLHAIFVAIGGGGLIAGIAAYVKAVRPDIKIIGVQTTDSDAMRRSIAAGERITLDQVGLFSDGTAVKTVGEETFRICQALVDDIVLVDTDAICAAIKDVFQDTRSILEPAGALAVAGLKRYVESTGIRGESLVAIACGANMNFDRMRFVADRAEVGEAREALFAVTVPEERGSFRRFCRLIGNRNVTEFNYRINDARVAHLFVGLTVTGIDDRRATAGQLVSEGFDTLDLSGDELAKGHIRYMVGGRSGLARDERLFRFEFPERPGALTRFLDALNPSWNVSLFHYRNQGADTSSILVGLQIPATDDGAIGQFLSTIGYPVVEETINPAYRLFL